MSDIPPPPSTPPPPPPGNLTAPPGYVGYGTGPTPTQRVGRIGGLATAITVLVAIAGIAGAIGGLLQLTLRSSADDFLADRISEDTFTDKLTGVVALSALGGIATLAVMVLVMIWMYRITSNIRAHGQPTTWHPLFAVFGWVLPPVIFVIPLLMLREQWSKSIGRHTSGPSPVTGSGSTENPMLWLWWVCFGLIPMATLALNAGSMFDGLADASATSTARTYADTNPALTMFGAIAGLVAAVAWLVFVRQLTARHRAMTGEN